MAKKKKKNYKKNHSSNKYSHLAKPQAVFDFHNKGILTEMEIKGMALTFIDECTEKGIKKILFITGKGIHSAKGPVITPLLQGFLPSVKVVKKLQKARRDRGGEGAIEVELY